MGQSDAISYSDDNSGANSYSDADCHANADSDSDSRPKWYTDADRDANADSDSNTDSERRLLFERSEAVSYKMRLQVADDGPTKRQMPVENQLKSPVLIFSL